MPRKIEVWRDGKMVPKESVPPKQSIHVIGDETDVQSMVNGKRYSSKSKLRQHYRDAGVVEVGNDPVGRPEWGNEARNDQEVRDQQKARR